jgi:hypothetical protein
MDPPCGDPRRAPYVETLRSSCHRYIAPILSPSAGVFTTALGVPLFRNRLSGYFNVMRRGVYWLGEIRARGVSLRTSLHVEAWRAAAELDWVLDRWCRKHGEHDKGCRKHGEGKGGGGWSLACVARRPTSPV